MIKSRRKNIKKIYAILPALFFFALISVFGLSLLTGNEKHSNVGTSSAASNPLADLNNDSKVDITDLSILITNWNKTGSIPADINKDNIVGINDLSILLSSWGAVSPSPDCTKSVWQNLSACGWPSLSNTGYPVGQTFINTNARSITVDNTVIDGQKITGSSGDAVLEIYAKNVIVRNSWLVRTAGAGDGGTGVIKIYPGASASIEKSLLDGGNRTHSCIWHEGTAMTADANNCLGVNDGIFSWESTNGVDDGQGDNFVIKNNYLHDFTEAAANGHIDGYQTEGAKNGLIEHNTFYINKAPGDPSVTGGGITSAISIWNSAKSSSNITVRNNLIAGGGFAIYAEDYHPSESSPVGGNSVTNIRFENNKFSTGLEGNCVGYYGVWFFRTSWVYQGGPTGNWGTNGNIRTGNTILETGFNLDNGNPAGCT